MIFRFLIIIGALLGIIISVFVLNKTQYKPTPTELIVAPAMAPYDSTIAASGIIEAVQENVIIGVPAPGLITDVWVVVWEQVSAGQPLFQIDDRELRAQLSVQESNIEVTKATLLRVQDQLKRLQAVSDPRAVSIEEVKTKANDVEVSKAQMQYAETLASQTKRLIDRLTIRAPKDGVILQNNARVGEYASLTPKEPLMILGDLRQLQVRVDVDEYNASRVQHNAKAVAYPKNDPSIEIPLQFVRIEPYVIPKKSLTGLSDERVDTRVLQVIYTFDQLETKRVYVGQQVDVFIEAT